MKGTYLSFPEDISMMGGRFQRYVKVPTTTLQAATKTAIKDNPSLGYLQDWEDRKD